VSTGGPESGKTFKMFLLGNLCYRDCLRETTKKVKLCFCLVNIVS